MGKPTDFHVIYFTVRKVRKGRGKSNGEDALDYSHGEFGLKKTMFLRRDQLFSVLPFAPNRSTAGVSSSVQFPRLDEARFLWKGHAIPVVWQISGDIERGSFRSRYTDYVRFVLDSRVYDTSFISFF